MENVVLSIRLPGVLNARLENVVKTGGYRSRQEAIVAALREKFLEGENAKSS